MSKIGRGSNKARAKGKDAHILSGTGKLDIDEQYTADLRLLDEYTRVHPMCSLEATSSQVMQLVAKLQTGNGIVVSDLPVVGKSHDDLFLSQPNLAIGERPCVNGDRCMCVYMAKARYGCDTDRGFICKEYLLPDEHRVFLKGGGVPEQRKKCLICYRYMVNYIYIKARGDPSFSLTPGMHPQACSNKVSLLKCDDVPTHCNRVSCEDGYSQSAMLFVDEGFADVSSQRQTKVGCLLFRPCVKFSSTHYRYVRDHSRNGYMLMQFDVGQDDRSDIQSFRQPPSPTFPEAAAASKSLTRQRRAGTWKTAEYAAQ